MRHAGDPVVFLDKDGTLIEDIPYNVDPELIRLGAGARRGLVALHNAGYRLVVVTNQSGVARGKFPPEALVAVERRVRELLGEFGVPLAGWYICPHHPDGINEYAIVCSCRKPASGLVRHAARELRVPLSSSWLVGDILDDVEAGRGAGCQTVLIDRGNETEWLLTRARKPDYIVRDLAEAAEVILRKGSLRIPAGGLVDAVPEDRRGPEDDDLAPTSDGQAFTRIARQSPWTR